MGCQDAVTMSDLYVSLTSECFQRIDIIDHVYMTTRFHQKALFYSCLIWFTCTLFCMQDVYWDFVTR